MSENDIKKVQQGSALWEILMGIILIIVGVLLYLGLYQKLVNFGPVIDFWIWIDANKF